MPNTLEKILKANRWRIHTGRYASEDIDGWNGAFLVPVDGEMYNILIGDGMGWRHLSITNAQRKVIPSWAVMCRVKELFFGDDAWVVQFHPPSDEHVNDHPWCLHLWESIEAEMPHPSIVQV